jgi:integrase
MTDSVLPPADAAVPADAIQTIGDAAGGADIALAGTGPVSADALAALAAAIDFAGQALAPATLRAYRADWQHFCAWCRAAGWSALPAAPATVAAYLASLAKTHTSSALVRGIQRKFGRPVRQAAALATEEVRGLVATCETTPVGQRDRALLLLGYAGALRRSELVAIEYEHITFDKDGLRLLIPHAKGDQANAGANIGIPRGSAPDTCPVRALEVWLKTSKCEHGPVFRGIDMRGAIERRALHPDAVRQILRKRATLAGLVLPRGERLSPHGLRAGFITQAYINGARDEQIMDHTRQKDLRTMRGYVRRAKLVTESPAKLLGL